jgi:L-alanine-DL-glutamate epimerase-like enolase superfamily enzyme
MTSAPEFRVVAVERFERRVRFRLPFRFGSATVTEARQAFVRARIEFPRGVTATGAAAEMMMPKWFDKSRERSDADNVADLRESVAVAADAYASDAGRRSAFDHHAAHYRPLLRAAEWRHSNALTAGFGTALVDGALLDALCRHERVSFNTAMRTNLPGIDAADLAPDLAGFDLSAFLHALRPRTEIALRHTVGRLDPLTADDIDTRIGDGLPETLQEVIAAHRPRYFKLKLSGDLAADLGRIERVAALLDRRAGAYRVTLDGNEQFDAVESVVALWRSIAARDALARFAGSVLWIEQPLPRDAAEHVDVTSLARLKPVLIDESDAALDAFPQARALGYTGVSSKSCKGLYKSTLNAARCARWNAAGGASHFFVSGEDLTLQAGLAVQQDLSLAGLLGVEHVERNGHHYVDGFAGQGASEAEASRFLAAHPDLYEKTRGTVRLAVRDGKLSFASLDAPGFASRAQPDWESLEPAGAIAATAHLQEQPKCKPPDSASS